MYVSRHFVVILVHVLLNASNQADRARSNFAQAASQAQDPLTRQPIVALAEGTLHATLPPTLVYWQELLAVDHERRVGIIINFVLVLPHALGLVQNLPSLKAPSIRVRVFHPKHIDPKDANVRSDFQLPTYARDTCWADCGTKDVRRQRPSIACVWLL